MYKNGFISVGIIVLSSLSILLLNKNSISLSIVLIVLMWIKHIFIPIKKEMLWFPYVNR